LKVADLDYTLPPELIAQRPAERRDDSRLLMVDRAGGGIRNELFGSLPDLLPAGSLLVLNDTKVLPARLRLRRHTGGRLQGLFLREHEPNHWEVMLTSARRLKPGERLELEPGGQELELLERMGEGTWRAAPVPSGPAESILARYGSAPLPPYIHRDKSTGKSTQALPQPDDDLQRYQTIYARRSGAVAAPTAGLHFTPSVMKRLADMRITTAFVTLHVGVGTFAPIRVDDLAEHTMHSEYYECPVETAEAVNAARESGRPVVAVGTTSVRVLETCANEQGRITAGDGWTDIFIYPPYRYRAVDSLITNFHLPGSTLLALVFAFAGRDLTLRAYEHAVAQRYRFFSYGDAMLLK
jgi:S-adenosylmethionine:tRNA ribosyltransferase-isomerase